MSICGSRNLNPNTKHTKTSGQRATTFTTSVVASRNQTHPPTQRKIRPRWSPSPSPRGPAKRSWGKAPSDLRVTWSNPDNKRSRMRVAEDLAAGGPRQPRAKFTVRQRQAVGPSHGAEHSARIYTEVVRLDRPLQASAGHSSLRATRKQRQQRPWPNYK